MTGKALSVLRLATLMLTLSLIAGDASQAAALRLRAFNIEVGQTFAKDVAPTEDGDRAFVLFEGTDPLRVGLIDAATRSLVTGPDAAFDQHILPAGAAVVGRKLYISTFYSLVSVDIDTKLTTILFQPPELSGVGSPVVVSTSRRRVYTVAAGRLLAIDTATDGIVGMVPVAEGNYGIAVSPDERRVYLADSITGTLSRFDTSPLVGLGSSSFVTSTGIDNYGAAVVVGPEGQIYVGYEDHQPRFTLAVLDDLGSLRTTRTYDFPSDGLDLTRDGRYLITGSGAFIRRKSLAVEAQVPTGMGVNRVHVTLDGRRAYISNYNATYVTVIEIGAAPQPVTREGQPAEPPD